jgi:hypothetical protein
MPRLALYLLGPPRIDLDGQVVQVSCRKAAAPLAYLVLDRSQPQPRLSHLLAVAGVRPVPGPRSPAPRPGGAQRSYRRRMARH